MRITSVDGVPALDGISAPQLAGKPAGTYYVQVYPRLGSLGGNPKYSLEIKPPAPAGDDSVAYCMQTYKSYDPNSGTYLGYDGRRHPCP